MTREQRAVACITEHRGAVYATPKMVRAMLAFADAEAAAMRERAAGVADKIDTSFDTLGDRSISNDYIVGQESGREEVADMISTAIRALPTKE